MPRSIGPYQGRCVFLFSSHPCNAAERSGEYSNPSCPTNISQFVGQNPNKRSLRWWRLQGNSMRDYATPQVACTAPSTTACRCCSDYRSLNLLKRISHYQDHARSMSPLSLAPRDTALRVSGPSTLPGRAACEERRRKGCGPHHPPTPLDGATCRVSAPKTLAGS